ncbi:MAG: argininosuccinate lyase [Balneolaceae bacterium]
MSKLWQKKSTDTESSTAKKVEAFTVGNDYQLDQILVPYDIRASKVHAMALEKAGVLSAEEYNNLDSALSEILKTWEKGEFVITVEDEDMHTAIENSLTDKLGDLGKKIHTGRSRNDQVLTAMRLFEKEKLSEVLHDAKACTSLLLDLAGTYEKIPMPGFTHTRKAMLSSVGLWAGGFAELLILQIQSSSGIQSLINRSPLGTAAGFGTTFTIDRDFEAAELGFESPLICATSAQLSRGWVELQLVQFLAGITSVLNRLAADVIQYSSEANPYFELNPLVCTGSSIMPQKKNPDVAELIRAGHAEICGHAASLQMLITNLGSGYHRDLQAGKEPVLQSLQKTQELLEATYILISHLTPNQKNLEQACSSELFAAEAANKLVKEKGITFRDAYRKIADDPTSYESVSADEMFKQYTQLGSPGNAGINRLTDLLDKLPDY